MSTPSSDQPVVAGPAVTQESTRAVHTRYGRDDIVECLYTTPQDLLKGIADSLVATEGRTGVFVTVTVKTGQPTEPTTTFGFWAEGVHCIRNPHQPGRDIVEVSGSAGMWGLGYAGDGFVTIAYMGDMLVSVMTSEISPDATVAPTDEATG